jgi:hypothetical protein
MSILKHPAVAFAIGAAVGIMIAGRARSLPVVNKLPSV